MTKHKFYEAASTLLDRYSTPLEKDPLKDFKVEILKQLVNTLLDFGVGNNIPSYFSLHYPVPVDYQNIVDTVEEVFTSLSTNVRLVITEEQDTKDEQKMAYFVFAIAA